MDVFIASLVSWVCAALYFRRRHRKDLRRLHGIRLQLADRAYSMIAEHRKPEFLPFCSDQMVRGQAIAYGPSHPIHRAAHKVLNGRGLTVQKEV